MKQCPACKTTYTDETLSYCLSDGQPLVFVEDEYATVVNRTGEPTAVLSGGDKMRVEISQETVTSGIPQQAFVPPATAQSSGGIRIFIGALVVFLLLIAVVI